MSGKDLNYWREAWEKAGYLKDYQRADYLLKRYARQSFNSYGHDVANFYFGASRSIFAPTVNSKSFRSTPERQTMASVITDLQEILGGRPIYKDGDLHNILQIFGEKTKKDYMQSFKIVEKPSFFQSFLSFFQKFTEQFSSEKNNDSPKP